MATLALGAVFAGAGYLAGGTVAAGTVGLTAASGAAIGFSIGTQLGNYLTAPTFKSQGPRVNDLDVQGSEYGSPIPRCWGANRVSGQVIWSSGIEEVKKRQSSGGGKGGGGGGSVTTYSYNASFAVALCQGPITAIRRIWCDASVVYDTTQTGEDYVRAEGVTEGSSADLKAQKKHDKASLSAHLASGEFFERLTFYTGNETQLADGLLTADDRYKDTGAPAYRGLCYVVFETLQLEKFGNRIPNISVELYTPRAGIETPSTLRRLQQQGHEGQFVHIANDTVHSLKTIKLEPGVATFDVYKHRYGDSRAKRSYRINAELPGLLGQGSYNNATPLIGNSDTSRFVFFEATTGIWFFDTRGDTFSKPQGYILEGLSNTALTQDMYYSYRNFAFGYLYNSGGTESARVVVRKITGDGAWDDITYKRIGMDPVPEGFAMSDDGRFGFYSALVTIDAVSNWRVYKFDAKDNDLDPWQIAQFPSEGGPGELYSTAGSLWFLDLESIYQLDEDGQVYNKFSGAALFSQSNFFVTNNVIVTHSTGNKENWYVPSDPDLTSLEVGHVLEDLASEVGKTIDVTGIAGQTLNGFFRSRPMPLRAPIETLQQAFLFDMVEEGDNFRAVLRGGDSVFDVVDGELVTDREYMQSRVQDVEIPSRIVTTYQSANADYQQGAQQAQRIIGQSAGSATIELPMVLEDDQAAKIAEIFLAQAWTGRDRIDNVSLPPKYSLLEPADVFTLTSGEEVRRIRITKVTHTEPGLVDISGAVEDSEVYTSFAEGGSVDVRKDYIEFIGSTDLFILDIPLLASNHEESAVYVGANGSEGWRGAVVYGSADGDEFAEIGSVENPLTYGYTSNALADAETTTVDYGNTLTVVLQAGQLSSTSEDGFLSNVNSALVADEIITFRYAVLVAEDTYELSVMSRGRLGTEATTATHAVDDLFVLLDSALAEIPIPVDAQGTLFYVKAVTEGRGIDSAQSDTFTYQYIRGRPYAPSDLRVTGTSGASDYVLEWTRRARHTGALKDGSDVPVTIDAPETYDIEHWRANAMLTTAQVTEPTAVLPLLDGDEVRVAQVSPTYGPGLQAVLAVTL